MPLPFRPETTHALAGPEVEVDRAEPESPRAARRPLERGDAVAGPLARLERELELPRLERLLGPVGPFERALGLPHLAAQRIRAAAVGSAALLAEPGAAAGLDAALQRASASISRRRSSACSKRVVGRGARSIPRRLVLAEAARPLAHAPRAGLDLDDPRHRPVEELPVVRDDDEPAVAHVAGTARAARARRSRGRSSARRAAARRSARAGSPPARRGPPRRPRAPSSAGRATPGARARPRPRRPARRDRRRRARRSGRARLGVALVRVLAGGERADAACSSSRSASATPVRRASDSSSVSPGAALVLLRQIAGGQRGRRPRDPTRVGLVEAGDEPEQRRLADAVRADEAEPPLRS